jgi:hypothetical protein
LGVDQGRPKNVDQIVGGGIKVGTLREWAVDVNVHHVHAKGPLAIHNVAIDHHHGAHIIRKKDWKMLL